MTAGSYPATPAEDVAYTYDNSAAGVHGLGRLTGISDESGTTSLVYDARGNVVEETRVIGSIAYTTGYSYDLADNLASIIYPSGRIVSYSPDTLGRIDAIETQADDTVSAADVVTNVSYLPFGPLAGFSYANGQDVAYSYDQDYRVTNVEVTDGVTQVQDLAYTYDAAGNATQIADAVDATRSLPLRLKGSDSWNIARAAESAFHSALDSVPYYGVQGFCGEVR